MSKLYLAYGSNLNLEQMYRRCPQSKLVATCELSGWKTTFRGNRRGCGVMNLEKSKNGIVPVGIFEITENDEKNLDRYEGYPTLYYKKYFILDLPQLGGKRKVMAYVMTNGHEIADPWIDYYNTILQGYIDCGFDPQILIDSYNENSKNVMWY